MKLLARHHMRISLALCPRWDSLDPSAGLASLAGTLRQAGHEPAVFDLNKNLPQIDLSLLPESHRVIEDPESHAREFFEAGARFIEPALDLLLQNDPALVGFSVYNRSRAASLALAKAVKRRSPSTSVVFGGPSCFDFNSCLELIREGPADAVVFGEGEKGLASLADSIGKIGKPRPGPGILLAGDPSSWVPGSDVFMNLDETAFLDFTAFGDLSAYRGKTLTTNRGCVRRCNFCSDWRQSKFRQMSGKRIFSEVRRQLSIHPSINYFFFSDSLMNADIRALDEFTNLVLENGITIGWGGMAIVRPEMTPERLARMRRAGCLDLTFGIESGSAKVLKLMEKYVDPELNGRVMMDTTAAGIQTAALTIVGYLGETEEDFEETVSWIGRYGKGVGSLWPSPYALKNAVVTSPKDLPETLYWSREGNTPFVRINRCRRLIDAAKKVGVPVFFDGKSDPDFIESRFSLFENEASLVR